MFSSIASFKPVIAAVTFTALMAVKCLLPPLENRGGAAKSEGKFRTEQVVASTGHGNALALLGGMRAIVASGCWLRANLAWERRDIAATTALIDLTVAADERSLYFWLNGARILANDVPEWRMAGPVPSAFRPVANEEQAQVALRFLEKGLRWHGPEAAIYIEMANIHFRRRGDMNEAARYYRLAAEQPGAPYYAARIHAELLRSLGRPAEALVWLRQIVVTLPVDDETARRDVVIERIKLLEQELGASKPNVF
jgi:hypothetical protein